MTEQERSGFDKDLPFHFSPGRRLEIETAENWKQVEYGIIQSGKTRDYSKTLVAALLLLVIAGGAFYFWQSNSHNQSSQLALSEFRTGYGEIKKVTLPDSTVVTLNANSFLKIPEKWSVQNNRNVWLEGEAYFEVTKKPGESDAEFIVHTDLLDITVLGTKFNVNTHDGKAVVSLKEGKITITAKEKLNKGDNTITMKPGDVVSIVHDTAIVQENKNVEQLTDWTNHRFHFDNTPLADIALLIKNTYGYDLVVSDSTLLSRKISGDLQAENIEEFINALQVTLKLNIELKDKQVVVSP